MSHSDPIADMLTRIRNACLRRKPTVIVPASKLKLEIARILKQHGFIESYEFSEENQKTFITISLRYIDKRSAILGIRRLSRPGQRLYTDHQHLGMRGRHNQVAILSTSKGVMTTFEANQQHIGGELICTIW